MRILMLSAVIAGASISKIAVAQLINEVTDHFSPVIEANKSSQQVSAELARHMRKIALQKGGQISIDFTDPKQKEYYLQRLLARGDTRDRLPQFYRMLDNIEQRQRTSQRLGKFDTIDASLTTETFAEAGTQANTHTVFGLYISNDPEEGKSVSAKAFSSAAGGSQVTNLDVILFDKDGNQLSLVGSITTFDGGTQELATTEVGIKLLQEQYPNTDTIIVDSVAVVADRNGEETVTYRVAEYPIDLANPQALGIEYKHIHPNDRNGDFKTIVCLNRNYGDCDYSAQQMGSKVGVVEIPWKGEIVIPHRVRKIYAPSEVAPGVFETTSINVSTEKLGGSHSLDNAKNKTFADYIDYEVDEANRTTTLRWDIPHDEGVFGDAPLFDRHQRVDWWWHIVAKINPFFHPYRSVNALISATSLEDSPTPTNLNVSGLLPLQIVYSCLAKGSLIEMASGEMKPIESVKVGELVKAKGAIMKVTDTSIGHETIPMVKIKDDQGHELLLTESHPVETVGNGILWASELELGHKVYTAKGLAKIVSIEAVDYSDAVYNLDLEPQEGKAESLAADAEAFYANGILVGDLSTQTNYEFKNTLGSTEEEVLRRLPKKWHQDYLNSKK